tara:strand:- start:6752 stop:9523 length:2772 start_codon:yes stop_codon:yes gene_type:complete
MAKSRYKPGGERRGFKRLGEGLRASESRIQEQQKIQIDSLRLAALRQKEIDNQFISGLSNKHRFEEGVLREKQELENKARTRKYEAFQKFAETDVARMEGEAKALKEKADYWKDFAPKFAKNLSKLAQGVYAGQDRLRGEAELDKVRKSGVLNKITDQATLANFQLGEHVKQDTYELDPDQANVLHDKTFKISTHWAAKRVAQWYKENKSLVRSDAIAAWEARGDVKYGYDNALEVQELSARLLLERLGMSPKSEGGREILDMASAMGREDKKKFWDSHQYKLTDERIEKQISTLSSLEIRNKLSLNDRPSDAAQFKSGIHALAQQYKNGYHKSGNTITNPYDHPMTVADSLDKAKRGYIDHNIKTLSREDVQYILAIDIPDTGKGEKIVPFDKKHPVRAESILNDFDEAKAKQHSNLQNVQKQKGLTALNTFKEKVKAYEAKKGQEKGTKPWNEQRLEWINEIMEDSSHTAETRNQALFLIDFDPTNHNIAEVYVDIKRALIDGDTKEAMRLLRGIEGSDQKTNIQEEIKLLDELNAYGEIEGTGQSGIFGVSKGNKVLFTEIEATNPLTGASGKLSRSAEKATLVADSIWLAAYKKARVGGKQSVGDSIAAANTELKRVFDEGAEAADGTPGKGPLARTRGDGTFKNKWIYTAFEDHDTTVMADYSKRTITEEEANEGNWDTLTKDTIDSISTGDPSLVSNYDSINDIIKHPRFINTVQAKRLSDQLKRLSQLDDYENIDIDVPQAILVAAANSKYSVTQIVNAVIEAKKDKWTFLKDTPKLLSGSSEATLLNNDTYNKPNNNILPQNENGTNYFNAAFANTGERPMRRQVRASLKEGKTTEQIFSEITGVQIEHTENGFVYSDSAGYLRNGGLDMPLGVTPFELIKSSGLMSIIYQERLKQDLKKIKNKVELPYRLPKGG